MYSADTKTIVFGSSQYCGVKCIIENNALWCGRFWSRIRFDSRVRKAAFYVRGLNIVPSRGVFEANSSVPKIRMLAHGGVCHCERVHRTMRRERPNNALGSNDVLTALSCSDLLNRNYVGWGSSGNRVWILIAKSNRIFSSRLKRRRLKVEFSAEWLSEFDDKV